jgi:hypothetical protein
MFRLASEALTHGSADSTARINSAWYVKILRCAAATSGHLSRCLSTWTNPAVLLDEPKTGGLVTVREKFPRPERAGGNRQYRAWVWPTFLVMAAVVGALLTLATVWAIGPSSRIVGRPSSLQAGFASNTMKIVDQLGTVDVNVWVKNESRATQPRPAPSL